MENYIEKRNKRTNILSVVPLRGKVAFPSTFITFDAGREATLKAIERAKATEDKLIFICTQKDTEKDEVEAEDIYKVGTVARIKQTSPLAGGTVRVLAEGLYRARARSIGFESGYFYAVTDEILSRRGDPVLEEAYFRTAKELVRDVLSSDGKIGKDVVARLEACTDPDAYIDATISAMRVRLEVKQEILEEEELIVRFRMFERCLNDELEISKVERKISAAVRKNIDKSQKEYYLREQLKAIHSELGDDGKEEDEYREKVKAKGLPEKIEEKCLKELDRLSKMQSSSPEYTVITGYLDWILDLPWTEETKDTEKLSDCIKVLEADHYGLEKIKERITEYLAVLKLTGNMKAPILCLVGPPGVGKTSIARSVARALGREFVRMSLGGVKDEAEVRGHRRTYIGAMPGRILYAMKNAGSVNPVFLLDEIDKISSDMRGDPASALLEVLDPEQNSTFRDRYLEVPYDLSKVLFITTANTLDTIPGPLRDRMEIIELSGYTLEEKKEIAKRYLIPKQLAANGLTAKNASFTDSGIRAVIEGYTMEAGVRTLERTVGTVCRKIAVKYADDKGMAKVSVDKAKTEALLGAPRFKRDEPRDKEEIGAVTGLAWTAVGGTTLTVEVSTMKGKGEIRLTGKLGEVMKESALAAMTFIRAHADKYGIDSEKFETTDIHIHVPEGATPKDGPSAGVTIATAILSALTGLAVRKDIAMTGEITLRGKVLPIGGLKEKSLAARRVGIKKVIIPLANERDVEEVPEKVRKEIEFFPVSDADEVFRLAIRGLKSQGNSPEPKKKKIKPLPSAIAPTDGGRASIGCR
ncbi:MAG: endopeptidase La [Clostridia bacterium]|nr:endopeptidase La [Clostridia bacterium]